MVVAREELAQLREQFARRLSAEQFVHRVDEAELGRAEGRLVEHAAEQLAWLG